MVSKVADLEFQEMARQLSVKRRAKRPSDTLDVLDVEADEDGLQPYEDLEGPQGPADFDREEEDENLMYLRSYSGIATAIRNIFYAPLNDLGDGAVNTTPAIGVGPASFTRTTIATTRSAPLHFLPTGERITADWNLLNQSLTDPISGVALTVTRAGATATRFNSAGVIELVAADTPRYDFDPITLALKGLLIEPPRTNVLARSNDFGHAFWTKSGVTVTRGEIDGLDGTLAHKLLSTSDAGALMVSTDHAAASTAQHSASVYLKRGNHPFGAVTFRNNTTATNLISLTINFETGVINPIGTATARSVQCRDGWWRVEITSATGTITAGNNLRLYVGHQGATNSSGQFNYAFGAQIELGTECTSYIPTTTAAVARAGDQVDAASIASWYNQHEGTFWVKFKLNTLPDASSQVRRVLHISDGTTDERMEIRVLNTAAGVEFTVVDGAVTQTTNIINGSPAINTEQIAVAAYKTDNVRTVGNPGITQSDTGVTLPTVTTLCLGRLGTGEGSFHLHGHLQRVMYAPTRIPNASEDVFAVTSPTLVAGQNLKQVASGVARSYYMADGTYAGYLAEASAQNISIQSEDLATSWVNVRSSELVDCMVAPNGTITADKLIEDATAAATHQAVALQPTITADATQAVSAFFRAGERSWVLLMCSDATATNSFGNYFDLTNGVPGSSAVLGAGTVANARVENWGNGWYRCVVTGAVNAGVTTAGIRIGTANADNGQSYNGDGASGLYCWGMQQENNATDASSYIPTTTVAVTRNGDRLLYPHANVPHRAGSCYAEIFQTRGYASGTGIGGIWVGAASAGYIMWNQISSAPTTIAFSDGASGNVNGTGFTSTLTGIRKRATTWGRSVYVGGDGTVTVSAYVQYRGQIGTSPSNLMVGTSGTIDQPNGCIKELRLWDGQNDTAWHANITA